jgi:hypothetical protein
LRNLAATEASHARVINEADGERGLLPDLAAVSLDADVRCARLSSRLSVKDRRVHGETRKFRRKP